MVSEIETTDLVPLGGYREDSATQGAPLGGYKDLKQFSPEYANNKAIKFNYVLDELSPGVEQIASGILSQGPDTFAESIKAKEGIEMEKTRVEMLTEAANASAGKALDAPTYDFLNTLSKDEGKAIRDAKDPKAVANDIYARKVASGSIASTDYAHTKVFDGLPNTEAYHKVRDVAEAAISWNEYIYDTINDLDAQYYSKSSLGKGYEYFEQYIIPGASYFNKREQGRSIFLGSNLTEQYQRLWALPIEMRREAFKKVLDTIAEDNILDAREFAEGALAYSRQQQVLDNAGSVLELTTAFDAADIGKSLLKSSSTKGIAKGSTKGVGKKGGSGFIGKVIEGKADRINENLPDNIVQAVRASKQGVKDIKQAAENALTPEDIWIKVNNGDMRVDGQPSRILQLAMGEVKNGRVKTLDQMKKFVEKVRAKEAPKTSVPAPGIAPDETVNRMREALDKGAPPTEEQFLKTAAQDAVEASDPTNPNLTSDLLAASGKEAEAAAVKAEAIGNMKRASEVPTSTQERVQIESFVPSMYSPRASMSPKTPIGKVTNRLALRISDTLDRVSTILNESLANTNALVNRIGKDPNMYKKALEVGQAEFKKLYPSTNDAVLDVQILRPDQTMGNVIEMYSTLGRPDQTLFERPEHAYHMATGLYNLKPDGFDVIQIGNDFAIRIKSVVPEQELRSFLIPADGSNSTPSGIANTLLRKVRSADALLSKAANENRAVVTAAHAGLQANLKKASDAIQKVSKIPGAMKRFERVLNAGLNETTTQINRRRNPITKAMEEYTVEVPGKEWDAPGFERKYLQMNGQLPTAQEVEAYEVYKMLNDFDEAVRNLDYYSEKAALGYNEWRFMAYQLQEDGSMANSWTKNFDAKLIDDLPYDADEDLLAAIPLPQGGSKVLDVRRMTPDEKELVQQLKKEGYRIIQVMAPDQMPLRDALDSEEAINFVLVKDSQVSPLKLKQFESAYGGHRIVKEDWYVKAANIVNPKRRTRDVDGNVIEEDLGVNSYQGDITLFGVHSEAKAKEIVPLLEKARQLFNSGDRNAFVNFVGGALPNNPDRLWDDFKEGVIPSKHPFFVTKSGQGVNDTKDFKNYSKNLTNFKDRVDSMYNDMRKVNKKFIGEKSPDVHSFFRAEGTEDNPVFKFKTARYIDALAAMESSMSSLMKNRVFKDYVSHSVNSFVEEFGDLLLAPGVTKDMLKNNPLHYLHNPQWVDKPVERGRLAAAKGAREAIINLLGTHSDLRANIDWIKGKAIDMVYKNVGDKASEVVSDAMLPTVTDPFRYVRAFAFNTKIGLFNAAQILTQGMNIFNMTAITGNPARAMSAMSNAVFMQMARHTENPNIISHLADLSAKAGGGSKELFMESWEALKKTGWAEIEGSHAWDDQVLDPDFFKGKMGTFFDKGRFFFDGIERYNHLTAWSISFKEWKKLNPNKILSHPDDVAKVLKRADILNGLMSRASNSALQKGILSIPTQFMSYQMRLWDLMLGKTLTGPERARLFIMQNILYGVPVGGLAGLTAPWYDDIVGEAERRGYKTTEGLTQFLTKGATSFAMEGIFGDDFDAGKRLGPGGIPLLKMIVDPNSNDDLLLGITGASTSVFTDTARWSAPAITGLWAEVMEDGEDKVPLDPQTFIDAFRSISSVNNTVKAYFALAYGAYYSRDGQKIADVNAMDAFAIGLGFTPGKVGELSRQIEYIKDDREAIKILEKEYLKNMNKMFRTTDPEDKALYKARAAAIRNAARLTSKEKAIWFRHALTGNEALVEKMDEEYRKLLEQRNIE